jgi:hypothetical protein
MVLHVKGKLSCTCIYYCDDYLLCFDAANAFLVIRCRLVLFRVLLKELLNRPNFQSFKFKC